MSEARPDFASGSLRDAVMTSFRANVVETEVMYARDASPDEVVFIVSTSAAAHMRERDLMEALTRLLARKVWVTTDSDVWRNRTEVL